MIESFFVLSRIQKLIDFGNASDVHSSVTFCPMAAPTNWFWIIIIGGTVQKREKSNAITWRIGRDENKKVDWICVNDEKCSTNKQTTDISANIVSIHGKSFV